MAVAMKQKNDVNDQAFEKSLETFRDHIGSYGTFTDDELQTMRKFFDLNTEAQELGVQADSIRAEVETFETQIADARRRYASLIAEGLTQQAMDSVEQIPSLRKRQDVLKNKLPSIAGRLTELEKEVSAIDHCKYRELAKQAADDAEKMRCRAVSIFGRPSDVRKTISESKRKIG